VPLGEVRLGHIGLMNGSATLRQEPDPASASGRFFCRRAAAEAFRAAWGKATGGKAPLAPEMDAVLHEERLDRGRKRVHAIPGSMR
jgi:hypothetical protein